MTSPAEEWRPYAPELIDSTRTDLETQAATGGFPDLRWTDSEIIMHLVKLLPTCRRMREAGEAMSRSVERRLFQLVLDGKTGGGISNHD